MKWIVATVMGSALLTSPRSESVLYIFFTPTSPNTLGAVRTALRLASREERLTVKAVLLVERFFTSQDPEFREDFLQSIRELQQWSGPDFFLAVYDEDGLKQATRLGLTSTPALVLEKGGVRHVAYGTESPECRRKK